MDRFWGQPTMVFRSATFVVRSGRAGTESFLREVEQAVWSVDPNLPLAQVRTLDEVHRRSLARMTFTLVLLGIAGAMGLLLGLVGIYGVVARAGALQGMFVREAARLAGAGVAAGLAAAAALSRLMSSLLFGVGPLDPVTYAIVTLLLIAVAMAAAYVPARRSTRVDPIEVLRNA
jgi:hypothetical protein